MNSKRIYQRRCEDCGHKLVKNGKESGRQRWRCKICGTARVKHRPDVSRRNQSRLIKHYLTNTTTVANLIRHYPKSRTTFWRERSHYYTTCFPRKTNAQLLLIDAKGLHPGVVAIVRDKLEPLNWNYGDTETSELWRQTLASYQDVRAIVSDGQKGIEKALDCLYGNQLIRQRCLVHVERNITQKITRHPETKAGQDLRWLIDCLFNVNTELDKINFETIFFNLYGQHQDFLNHKTINLNPRVRRKWWHTHSDVRSAYRQIHKLIEHGQLFAYIDHPELEIPRTTNLVEGGINARIDELLRVHRGIKPKHKQAIIDAYLCGRIKH
jgi:transposase-like protein